MRWAGLLAVGLGLCGGCGGEHAAVAPAASLETDATELLALKTIKSVPVEQVARAESHPFFVAERAGSITQFPCSSCHMEPLVETDPMVLAELRQNHVDVVLAHASPDVMDCTTCHEGVELDRLRLNTGKQVEFNHAYRLCAQCHYQQAEDWAGGAHGKRLVGWQGKRVVMNCTECHDPHAPAIESQMPVMGPRIPRHTDSLTLQRSK